MAERLPSGELAEDPSDFGALRPGTRLGRYELLVPIARGGMARVWAARLHGQRGFQKPVAIKTILPHLASEPEFERMFLDEARIASGVHHPNVCEIYELGEENRTLYLAMEWVTGDSFSRVLRPNGKKTEALDPRVVARILADACAGLHAAHELADEEGRPLGVVHRDLSPHNVLLTGDGVAKVCDFGVAKALGQLHEATSTGQLKGKVAYMAPEQVSGAAIDRRSDVFSLGVVLYEATTGVRPFRGEGEAQVMHAVLKGEFEAPSSLIRNYPPELERIVTRALAPQAILRFPTAERMRFALEEFLARGMLVTQANVAQVVRARIGDALEKRKERIRQASNAGDRDGWNAVEGAGASRTPSNHDAHRSGVKAAVARPLYTTVQMDPSAAQAPDPGMYAATQAMPPMEPMGPIGPTGTLGATRLMPPGYPGEGVPPEPATLQNPPLAMLGTTLPLSQPAAAPPPYPVVVPAAGMPPQTSVPPMPPPSFGASGRMPTAGPMPGPAGPPMGPGMFAPGEVRPYADSVSAEHPAPPPPAGAAQYAIAAAIGVLLAVVIGSGAYFVWGRQRGEPPPALLTEPTSAPAPTPSPLAPSSDPTPASAQAPSPSPAPGVSTEIAFRVTPPDAVLRVDGTDLSPETRSIPRPAAGKTVTVVAHAQGFEDATFLVDYFTRSPMDLSLRPAGTTKSDPGTDPGAGAASKDVAKPDVKPDQPKPKKPKKDDSALPANPY